RTSTARRAAPAPPLRLPASPAAPGRSARPRSPEAAPPTTEPATRARRRQAACAGIPAAFLAPAPPVVAPPSQAPPVPAPCARPSRPPVTVYDTGTATVAGAARSPPTSAAQFGRQ